MSYDTLNCENENNSTYNFDLLDWRYEMVRYWVIAAVQSNPPELFEKVWNFDLENEVISIGWELGDISQMNRDQLIKSLSSKYPEKPQQSISLIANMLWSFYHEIKKGDYVIARRGRKAIAAVGQVVEEAQYKSGFNPDISHTNFLKVSWNKDPRNKVFPTIIFPMYTLTEIDEADFLQYVEGTGVSPEKGELSTPLVDESSFVLEKYLEEFIVSNFNTIFKGQINIFEDSEGNKGQQYNTEIGSIDILAEELSSNSFVVIELKKGRPSDQVVGQILRYMGWVKQNLCTNSQSVKGIVICHEDDVKLKFALEMVNNVDVKYYRVSFELRDTP